MSGPSPKWPYVATFSSDITVRWPYVATFSSEPGETIVRWPYLADFSESVYADVGILIGSWTTKNLTGSENDRISSLPLFEEGSESGVITQNTGLGTAQLKLTGGPDGGPSVLVQGLQYTLPSAGRAAIVSESKATVVAVLKVVSSVTNGFANCGTSADDEHWGLVNGLIYTEFCSDTRTGEIYDNSSVLTAWHVAVIRRDGTTTSVWVNNTKIYEASIGSFSVAEFIGAIGVTAGGSIQIREVAWYADAPNDTAISNLISTVQARHGM